ncbi:uracil-DNA glycosylase [Paenibacillus sp. FSL R5-0912]|uniref:uracil-DNA glycosylase n=1 Tax=Paenibacillus sp. FSL R5-0912 TaxID=1536771 RepID=UPI0004F8A176|nr:uracil-DNA glycosylase [Paenibacillus sp. FSL R5-0912]AIQ39917.1 hypothetical protein R50912_07660 [Paenibacillus sp. FSL R5-0912]
MNGDDSWLHPEVSVEEKFTHIVQEIIRLIVDKQDFPSVNNIYADSMDRQANLTKYFEALYGINPKIIFIGEAPGVHGCSLTGIPFTSERILRQGRLERHFPGTNFHVEGNSYEGSANYFWEIIDLMVSPPILWNVFPLHPFKMENGVMKNRTPKIAEKKWGHTILQLIIELFPNIRIVSVGNSAKDTCLKLSIDTADHIIHPAYHAKEFREQMRSYYIGLDSI